MKFHPAFPALAVLAALLFYLHSSAAAMDDPGFAIKRMVIAADVVDREPASTGDTFSAGVGKIYCFLEAAAVERDTTVYFAWYHEKAPVARVPLTLSAGKRWRTWSSKKIGGRKGTWRVDLQEESGIILNSVSFTVR